MNATPSSPKASYGPPTPDNSYVASPNHDHHKRAGQTFATASQILDLLGDAPVDDNRLLVTGAAGAVGGYVTSRAQDRGWRVTGLARANDEEFVRSLGADFTTHPERGWDVVVDGAVLQEHGLALVRDGGAFVGVQPSAVPAAERRITVEAVVAHPTALD